MTIIERNRPYETLIRYNPDGTIGAHHVQINEVVKDGEVIAATTQPPQSVAGPVLDAVLGAATVLALQQAAEASARAVQLEQECGRLAGLLESANGKLEAQAARLVELLQAKVPESEQ